ncbi:MAG: primosomal protein N' [Desulfobacterales bacterium]|nr:primosomal protein N' [Desulfobacterales bacterium]
MPDLTPDRLDTIEVAAALPVYQTFTYSLPDGLIGLATPGMRVLVPFGRRRVTGYVLGFHRPPQQIEIKSVLDLLDDTTLFPETMVPFFRWIADYYIHPIGEVIKCALPGGLNSYDFATMSITDAGRRALQTKTSEIEAQVLKLVEHGNRRLTDIGSALKGRVPYAVFDTLKKRGWVSIGRELRGDRIRPRNEVFVAPAQAAPDPGPLAGQRKKIWEFVTAVGDISIRHLQTDLRTTRTTINAMVESGYLSLSSRPVYRDPFGDAVSPDIPLVLNSDQHAVVNKVTDCLGQGFAAFLLAGVTGSGKTEVYLQLAAAVIGRGYPVLILIPEIALISQIERRFRARFGERVAVLHSGLTAGQRYDQWLRIRRGEVQIAIGARSAVFAPFQRIGLIVVDEEHDTSYKQEGSLRYNACDLAVVRAKLDKGVVLLGSATPSIQSSYNASQKKYVELTLGKRVEERSLPEITVVDLRKTRDLRGSGRFITAELHQAMTDSLARGEQVLLFLNRRGFASFPVCRDCGESIKCKNCDISLTLHRQANAFKCHYCGFMRPATTVCDKCGSAHIKNLGLGTEKVESFVAELFPAARVARMDRDTTSRRGSIVRILKDLRHRRIDILIGTQMVAKGHDFPLITLVGILCADLSMSFPDFRAGERTFQLLAQVAGRAGRGDKPGKVILQTYNPEHFSIQAAQNQDFREFYRQEIVFRRALKYPPFSRIIQLKIAGRDKRQTETHARSLGEVCRRLGQQDDVLRKSVEVMGPIEAALARIAGKYRWQILLKGQRAGTLHRFVWRVMTENPALFNRRGVTVAVDVDPFFMM